MNIRIVIEGRQKRRAGNEPAERCFAAHGALNSYVDEGYLDLHWAWVKDFHRSWSPLMTETISMTMLWD